MPVPSYKADEFFIPIEKKEVPQVEVTDNTLLNLLIASLLGQFLNDPED